ncbi:MAG: translesion error-prone DNA polymerase V autoproteolytic subunit [Vicingaceae bacterium]
MQIVKQKPTKRKFCAPIARLSAGFPSPALDYEKERIDLNEIIIKNPEATYYARVDGESMKEAGIRDGDLLVVDKSIEAQDGQIAVCFLNGEFTLKRLKYYGKELWLIPENKNYSSLKVEEESDFRIWGVVTYVIKKTI